MVKVGKSVWRYALGVGLALVFDVGQYRDSPEALQAWTGRLVRVIL
jgi:hypothetical protein